MLDRIKRKELDADIATLEVGTMNLSAYEKMLVLKLVKLIDDAEKYAREDERTTPRYAPSASSGSEFLSAIAGKNMDDVMDVMDELMETLKTVNARAYNGVMRKIEAL